MENSKLIKDENLKVMLEQVKQPQYSEVFTQAIMDKVQALDLKSSMVKKYLRRSWIFFTVAILFSFRGILAIENVQQTFATMVNFRLVGFVNGGIYLLITALAALILYQWNALLVHKFEKSL